MVLSTAHCYPAATASMFTLMYPRTHMLTMLTRERYLLMINHHTAVNTLEAYGWQLAVARGARAVDDVDS